MIQNFDEQFRSLYASLKISEDDLEAKEKYLVQKLEIEKNTDYILTKYSGDNRLAARIRILEGILMDEQPEVFEKLAK